MKRPGEVVIVSGLPRSGTSMMMRMIAAGGVPPLTDSARGADEDNPLGYFEYEPVKRTKADASWLDLAGGHVVKMVHMLIQDLPTDLPGRAYAVVLMHRDLDEVLASQAKMLARSGRAAAPGAVLRRVYEAQMGQVKGWMDRHAAFRRLDVDYARVVADPAGEAGRVAAFLGLATAKNMAAAVDPSLHRNKRS